MVEIRSWMDEFREKLLACFGDRLLFLGLQGSYRRGEATPASDIDVVTVLDTLDMKALQAYKTVVSTIAEKEKACGFICGREELADWPRHELFQLVQDTEPLHGQLLPLLPDYSREDTIRGVKIGVSALYHEACHRFLYGTSPPHSALEGAYKSACFSLQLLHYLRTGAYIHSRRDLLPLLEGEERAILDTYLRWDTLEGDRKVQPEAYFQRIIDWCGGILRQSII